MYSEKECINCKFKTLIYPKSSPSNSSWRLVKYIDENGQEVFASGNHLPIEPNLKIQLFGNWKEETEKYKKTFVVSYFDISLPTNQEGVMTFISSLKIGIGKIKAKALYKVYGENLWNIIEKNPTTLKEVHGMTDAKINRLVDKMQDQIIKSKLVHLFEGTIALSPLRLNSIRYYYRDTQDIVSAISENPYALCSLNGFNFYSVDAFGRLLGIAPNNLNRIYAAIDHLLQIAHRAGHVCLPKDEMLEKAQEVLNKNTNSEEVELSTIANAINAFCKDGKLRHSNGMIYTDKSYDEEVGIVEEVFRLMKQGVCPIDESALEAAICNYEEIYAMTLAESQKLAIKIALKNKFSIVTGGPGTGKSTIIKAIMWVFKKLHGAEMNIRLLAPTGKAARRMEEATGAQATTVHNALGFSGEDSSDANKARLLEDQLIIVDECSMLDQYITYSLLKNISSHSRLIFVGDPEQLPSVGAGNILLDFISSKAISTTKLDVVFRQAKGNPIIENANKIRTGDLALNFDNNNFHLYQEDNEFALFKRAVNLYLTCVKAYGIDNVVLLCPYRHKSDKTHLNVCVFNEVIQKHYNPLEEGDITMESVHGDFRKHDIVMMMRNKEYAKNGDVGTIVDIQSEVDAEDPDEKELFALIDFHTGNSPVKFTEVMMRNIELAYCTTIYKSQGSQYQTVIMVLGEQHAAMLNRATVYTGYTRAKENVAVVTNTSQGRNAFERAILNDKSDQRHSLLAQRLYFAYNQEQINTNEQNELKNAIECTEYIAVKVGVVFILMGPEEHASIELKATGSYVCLENVKFPLYSGTTFAESQKIDNYIDSHDVNVYYISDHQCKDASEIKETTLENATDIVDESIQSEMKCASTSDSLQINMFETIEEIVEVDIDTLYIAYARLCDEYSDKLILIQNGKDFVSFGQRSETVQKVLGIEAIVNRVKAHGLIETASIFSYKLDKEVEKLRLAGHDVLIARFNNDSNVYDVEMLDAMLTTFSTEIVNQLLRLGLVNEQNRKIIFVDFMRQKGKEAIIERLKECYTSGVAIEFENKKIAAWFDKKDGMHLSEGLEARFVEDAEILSWGAVYDYINDMIQNGTYLTQEEQNNALSYNFSQLSERLMFISRDIKNEGREKKLLSIILEEREDEYGKYRGCPKWIECLVDNFKSPDWVFVLTKQWNAFYKLYKENPSDIMRFKCSYIEDINKAIADVSLPIHDLPKGKLEIPEAKLLISDDRINETLCTHGTGFENGAFEVYDYFKQKHTKAEYAEFVKDSFGTGGYGFKGWSMNHDAKGIQFCLQPLNQDAIEVLLKWPEVVKRIQELIDNGLYLSDENMKIYQVLDQLDHNKVIGKHITLNGVRTTEYVITEFKDKFHFIAEAVDAEEDTCSALSSQEYVSAKDYIEKLLKLADETVDESSNENSIGSDALTTAYSMDEPEVLMPDDVLQHVPGLYEQDGVRAADKVVHAGYYIPFKTMTWYLTEYDPNTQDAFGLVIGQEPEWGYFNLEELSKLGARRIFTERFPKAFKDMESELTKQLRPEEIERVFFGTLDFGSDESNKGEVEEIKTLDEHPFEEGDIVQYKEKEYIIDRFETFGHFKTVRLKDTKEYLGGFISGYETIIYRKEGELERYFTLIEQAKTSTIIDVEPVEIGEISEKSNSPTDMNLYNTYVGSYSIADLLEKAPFANESITKEQVGNYMTCIANLDLRRNCLINLFFRGTRGFFVNDDCTISARYFNDGYSIPRSLIIWIEGNETSSSLEISWENIADFYKQFADLNFTAMLDKDLLVGHSISITEGKFTREHTIEKFISEDKIRLDEVITDPTEQIIFAGGKHQELYISDIIKKLVALQASLKYGDVKTKTYDEIHKEKDKAAMKEALANDANYDIGCSHLGNGITVWNRNDEDEQSHDYRTLAHISPTRDITYYVEDLPEYVVARIEEIAETPYFPISSTQSQNVFSSAE